MKVQESKHVYSKFSVFSLPQAFAGGCWDFSASASVII